MSAWYKKNNFKKIIIILLFLILAFLNYNKYKGNNDFIVPVWSSRSRVNYNLVQKEKSIKKILSPDRIIYSLTGVRIGAPLTYLKNEIPLLSYYTPQELRSPSSTIYQPEDNNIIKLKFDLGQTGDRTDLEREETKEIEIEEFRLEERFDKDFPLIAIYHTHTSETYKDDPRKQDNNFHVLPGNIGNVARVGMEMAEILSNEYNFKVIHTTKIHDYNYSRSYYNSRETVKEIIDENPDVDLLLDIHRDGIQDLISEELITTMLGGKRAARVMIVVTNGKFDFAHLDLDDYHQNWQSNLEFAEKLADKMEEMYPGLLSRIEVKEGIYNQDLHPRSILLEIGDYRNTTAEAVYSARLMADVIAEMFK